MLTPLVRKLQIFPYRLRLPPTRQESLISFTSFFVFRLPEKAIHHNPSLQQILSDPIATETALKCLLLFCEKFGCMAPRTDLNSIA